MIIVQLWRWQLASYPRVGPTRNICIDIMGRHAVLRREQKQGSKLEETGKGFNVGGTIVADIYRQLVVATIKGI